MFSLTKQEKKCNILSPCAAKKRVLEFLRKHGSHWLLRIVIFVMPGCHPVLLFHVFPVTISRRSCSLLPLDANRVVTGNLIFIFGSLKEATLQREENNHCLVWGGENLFRDIQEKEKTSMTRVMPICCARKNEDAVSALRGVHMPFALLV